MPGHNPTSECCIFTDSRRTQRRISITTQACNDWLDDFFESYYRFRPVNATFIGVHDFDHLLPDYSENGCADLLSGMHALLDRAQKLPPEPLSIDQQIDRQLCTGFLRLQCWEFESGRFHRGNPSLYCGEAIFGVMSLFLSEFAPQADRVGAATSRLQAIPALLRQGMLNLDKPPQPWTEQAIEECDGALRFLGDDAVLAAGPACTDTYRAGIETAARAFQEFRDHLVSRLADGCPPPSACGATALSLHMREAHCLKQDAGNVADYAREKIRQANAALDERLAEFGARHPADVLESLNSIHPDIDNYYERYQQMWDRVKALASAHDLVSWPDFPIQYIPQPRWARNAAPSLYFLNYRSPAAFGRPRIHNYLVTPIHRDMPKKQQEALLQANNDSAIKLNHVVHHGGIGHHLQNWHAFRAGSRVGQIAAVDCASRIAMHCGGTMAEGWACYATDLVAEHGGLTPLEEYAEIQTRTRMSARALIDVEFHEGRLDYEQAIEHYQKEAGMSAAAAKYEVTRNSMYPGMALMYLLGCDAIHDLRREFEMTRGEGFKLRDFHDRFLSYGSVPVALIAQKMRDAQNRQDTPGTAK